jgi:hypothetical protein
MQQCQEIKLLFNIFSQMTVCNHLVHKKNRLLNDEFEPKTTVMSLLPNHSTKLLAFYLNFNLLTENPWKYT